MSDTNEQLPETPVASPAALADQTPAQTPADAAPAAPEKSLEEAMGDAYDRVMSGKDGTADDGGDKPEVKSQARDASGKFAKAEPEAKGDEGNDPAGKEPPASPEGEKIPNSWPETVRAAWATLSPEQRSWFSQREQTFANRMTEVGRALKAYEPYEQAVSNHRDVFENANVHPAAVLDHLLTSQKALAADPGRGIMHMAENFGVDLPRLVLGDDPRMAIQTIASAAGIDLLDLALAASNGQPHQATPQPRQQAAPQDPRVDQLQSEIARLVNDNKQLVSRFQQQEQDRSQQAVLGEIDRFAQQHPEFEELLPLIIPTIPTLTQSNPELSRQEVLQLAFEQARRLIDSKVTAAEQKRLKEQSTRAAKSKTASAVNVRGSAVNGVPAAMSEQAEIDAVWSRLGQ